MKRLFLASEAKHPDSFEKLRELVGGFDGKKIVYIPTAANGEGWHSWDREGGTWKLVNSTKAQVDTIELEDYGAAERFEELYEKVRQSDLVWFAGGYCGYLLYWIRRAKLNQKLSDILEDGPVYVGSSAGSMIAGTSIDAASWLPGDEEFGAEVFPALGLVDLNIFPHFEDDKLDVIKQKVKDKPLYLLKNGEAIIVEGDVVKVFGETRTIN
ncbi:Type 1 glutamine amidotransferase-like domain-containing protein [candidate division WWE3 bacterium]|uniref:Type 1 glutamine amidotransferase-like domain-containing protein n=1 Tax=candidate division WWE3 bacterium TaxID=2053526 RepID=A0A955LKW2_UNCKA|nr:Type 1 glutamine amidotransferase-like domain-containing protein [candidate division WWE3 bacterium]